MLGSLSSKPQASKKKKKQIVDSTELFQPKSILDAVTEQVKPEGDWAKDWLGFSGEAKQGNNAVDMQPGVPYNPSEAQKQEQQKVHASTEAPMNYYREILHAGENKKDEQESSQKIGMLINELQRLAQSVAAIEKTVILQAIDPSAGQKTGKYYESFFEWMLMVIQDARRTVEDSGAWLSTMSGKKGKQGIHKTMKTNMQVGMSGERTQANNAG